MELHSLPRKNLLACLTFAIGTLVAGTASAQSAVEYNSQYAFANNAAMTQNSQFIGAELMKQNMMQEARERNAKGLGSSKSASAPSQPFSSSSGGSGIDFGYKPDAKVSSQMEETVLSQWQKTSPELAKAAAADFKKQSAIDKFEDNVKPYGLSADDLGDTMTAYWVLMWVSANQKDLPNKKQVQAVRKQVQAQLAQNKEATSASNTKRQQMAESFIYEFILMVTLRNGAQNAAQRQQLADAATKQMGSLNLDVQSMKLTDSGFVKAS